MNLRCLVAQPTCLLSAKSLASATNLRTGTAAACRVTQTSRPSTYSLQQPRRHINVYAEFKPEPTWREKLAAEPFIDHRISAEQAHVVQENNQLQPAIPTRELLRSLQGTNSHLRQVGRTPDGAAVCKIVSEDQLAAEFKAKQQAAVKRKHPTKQIELTWGIAANDLAHRLKRIKEFLAEGKRVDVLVAPKRRGRKAEKEEIDALLVNVREAVAEVDGAFEYKGADGVPGKQLEMYFQRKNSGEVEVNEADEVGDDAGGVDKKESRRKRRDLIEQERRDKALERSRRRREEHEQLVKMTNTGG